MLQAARGSGSGTDGRSKGRGPPNWGKNTIDEHRARSDRFFVNLEFFYTWRAQLTSTNQGKVGARFDYPAPLFDYLAHVRTRLGMNYRELERFAREMLAACAPRVEQNNIMTADQLRTPHFTQIRRRIEGHGLDLRTAERLGRTGPMYLILDRTGPQVATPQEWTREYVGKRLTIGWVAVPAEKIVAPIETN